MNEEKELYNKRGFGRWSWFAMYEKLANGDITKLNEVGEQNFITAINLLSYWKERSAEDKKREDITKNKK
jgi:hypothetical protein